ncbi:Uncharacterised protein [Mycobacteroides abscessus subsp. abscessus]|nr:Uncharacterised protein [Mycobacteroides abscessus subsp. abscessus]
MSALEWTISPAVANVTERAAVTMLPITETRIPAMSVWPGTTPFSNLDAMSASDRTPNANAYAITIVETPSSDEAPPCLALLLRRARSCLKTAAHRRPSAWVKLRKCGSPRAAISASFRKTSFRRFLMRRYRSFLE